MEQLSSYIRSYINIKDNDLQSILSQFTERKLAKGKAIVRRGQLVSSYFFIKSGGLRITLDDKGREVTLWFALANEFFTDLASLKNQTPSRFNIIANEDTVILMIRKENMDHLYEQFPVWQTFGRLLWENAFLKILDGIVNFQTLTAEERYLHIMKHTDLLDKVPLKQLASYLGVTAASLSRLRKNIK